MTSVIANENLSSFLAPLKERTEIKDTTGRLLGVFTPADEQLPEEQVQRPYAEIRKLFDLEEIKRRKERSRNDPGRPPSSKSWND